ncbi:MAG: response regulator transcription factor [Cyclobacteriaceae bacterium]
MNYQELVIWIAFALCLSLTAGGVLSIFRFEKLKLLVAFRNLQIALILNYTFGYYVLWSEIFFNFFPEEYQLAKYSQIASFMGMPFLFVGMLMILIWAKNVVSKKISVWLMVASQLLLIAAIFYFYLGFEPAVLSSTSDIWNAYSLGIWLTVLVLLFLFKSSIVDTKAKRILIGIMFLSVLLHATFLIEWDFNQFKPLIYNFLFFLVNTALVIVFVYKAKVPLDPEAMMLSISLEKFVAKHEITAREIEIIKEMVKGKTNQQIADTLFISLQTVKDHTSRIYLKSHLKNRAQLISTLRSSTV